jgi:hypothetical protein
VIGATISASLLTTAWYVTAAAPAVIGLARRRMMRCLALPITISGGAIGLLALTSHSAEPLASFVTAGMIAVTVVLTYMVLVFDTAERQSIQRFLCSALAIRSGTASRWPVQPVKIHE